MVMVFSPEALLWRRFPSSPPRPRNRAHLWAARAPSSSWQGFLNRHASRSRPCSTAGIAPVQIVALGACFLTLAAGAFAAGWVWRGRGLTHGAAPGAVRDQIAELESASGAIARAEAASEAKTRFLATMSHEIRTPLNGVLGMADLLAGSRLEPEQRTYVEAIRTSGQALASLIDEILDLSRVESGRLDLVEAPFELVALLEGVAELLAPRAQDKGLEIATSVAPDLPRAVLGDGARVRQVVLNLAGNAIKFTQSGGVGLRASRAGDHVRIEVIDTGAGVPAARRETIFEDFRQGDQTATRAHEGSGLG
ncbi:MAG: hypothetical protein K2Y29_08800, partial [Beijerinckiaceae bacterium]|nr:hypothetical protein [Beijerinckiaceae bacterium]